MTRLGLAQTAACCSLRSRREFYLEMIQIGITRDADIEPRVCASRDKTLMLFGDAKGFVGDIVRELTGGGH